MYTLSKWNGKYGYDAKFVAKDDKTGKQSMFVPGRTQDLLWTRTNLEESPEIKNWEDFGEVVENLEDVAF